MLLSLFRNNYTPLIVLCILLMDCDLYGSIVPKWTRCYGLWFVFCLWIVICIPFGSFLIWLENRGGTLNIWVIGQVMKVGQEIESDFKGEKRSHSITLLIPFTPNFYIITITPHFSRFVWIYNYVIKVNFSKEKFRRYYYMWLSLWIKDDAWFNFQAFCIN